jgi:hypothetical protein
MYRRNWRRRGAIALPYEKPEDNDAPSQRERHISMQNYKTDIEGVAVVLLGSFNPSIFQPAWLASHHLVRPEEAESATIEVIHPELSAFTTSWFTLQVQKDRFTVQTSDIGRQAPLRDLVLGIFQLLEHTPFDKMGINRHMHFGVPTVETWHAFGDFLAPKEPWRGILENPGLRSLRMSGAVAVETSKFGEVKAVVNVRAEPSLRVPHGIFIEVNQHHEALGATAPRALMKFLEERWFESIEAAKRTAHALLDRSPDQRPYRIA